MASGSALPQVERLFREGTVSGLSEAALLERFVARRDEAAFEALVARHGPLVLGVCRRILHDTGDVEDAFQATFLILVRKARSIRRREALGPWLYGVAYRVTRRSRGVRARRNERECPLAETAAAEVPNELAWRELRAVLDEELARLPDRHRNPLVLCYLQGLTHEEAALRIGCPVGTVRSRLARARERLGVRLVRRGLAPAAGLIGAVLAQDATASPLAPSVLMSTARAAARIAAGCAVSEVVSSTSASLLEGVIRTMFWNSWRKGSLVAISLGALLAGTVVLTAQATGDPPRRSARPDSPKSVARPVRGPGASKAIQRPVVRPLPRYVVQPPDLLIVEVLEALPGRPITGEHLVRPDGTMTLGFYGDLEVAGLTLPEIKEKVVDHLKKYLSEDTLGLWAPAPDGREGRIRVAPQDSGTVYVDVCAYNSAYYYVVGQVASAGRFPITGNETVLDAINLAGGLLGGAGPREVRLIRRGRGHNPDEVMPIDYQEISQGTDPSTNYQVMPGDRLVVTAAPSAKAKDADRPQPDAETSHPIMPGVRSVVTADPKVKSKDADRSPADADTRETRRLEQRLDRVEGKLDQILETLRRVVGDR